MFMSLPASDGTVSSKVAVGGRSRGLGWLS